jgi:hypothetical protein
MAENHNIGSIVGEMGWCLDCEEYHDLDDIVNDSVPEHDLTHMNDGKVWCEKHDEYHEPSDIFEDEEAIESLTDNLPEGDRNDGNLDGIDDLLDGIEDLLG